MDIKTSSIGNAIPIIKYLTIFNSLLTKKYSLQTKKFSYSCIKIISYETFDK